MLPDQRTQLDHEVVPPRFGSNLAVMKMESLEMLRQPTEIFGQGENCWIPMTLEIPARMRYHGVCRWTVVSTVVIHIDCCIFREHFILACCLLLVLVVGSCWHQSLFLVRD